MKLLGYNSDTFTYDYYSSINKRDDWDILLSEKYNILPFALRPYIAFIESLFKYDVFVTSFDGFFIGKYLMAYFQSFLLKTAGKKVIVIAYGADSYVYRRIRSVETIHGLLMSYPEAGRQQRRISKIVDYWIDNADVVIPGIMIPDGFGRWDVLMPSNLALDLDVWKTKKRHTDADGMNMPVCIVHAPNHRGFKGTEFIVKTIEILKQEGLLIELRLIEKMQNDKVRQIFHDEADILIEQIIFTGHGLNALEGMASGLPVISNLENEEYLRSIRRWSYFGECPLVSASPENLVDVLRKLITRPELRRQLGQAGRAYVEKYHGLGSAQYLFSNVIDYVYGRKESLINLYHPILGEYPNRSPRIEHPLVNNRIID
jgi:glycosyltransferase involved in cell wall biosynthesis